MSGSPAGESEVIGWNKQMYGDPKTFAKRAPRDRGEPQPEVVGLVKSRAIRREGLYIGCGTGEILFHLAFGGFSVTGLDAVPEAIQQAKERAAEGGVTTTTFPVADATDLSAYAGRFDSVDGGLLHVLDDHLRPACHLRRPPASVSRDVTPVRGPLPRRPRHVEHAGAVTPRQPAGSQARTRGTQRGTCRR
ncbi:MULTISPECIES: class I SAM-dependent methyltransferase [unclassified Streptomyces]|uniref:class I SAM-dependent methyltransferase n=1 Tax=unclassified Streptomyces TaxID=2593676 RepID=UPI0022B6B0FA|nr:MULTISPECIES: class I SAM-dependent methyltransferase [unclassified Streptomyces]MCZ7413496.1 class I SAM-dependent methyltransferase [Streptomyces sp. WMMC897]MCZ7430490.1 class I SAM-dependent methyltransferase [Streptomyces sp. WMMC1477]